MASQAESLHRFRQFPPVADPCEKYQGANSDIAVDDLFDQYFYIQLADTPDLLDRVFQLRFEVYCEEFKYERADVFPKGRESDEYDPKAQHCLLIHRSTGQSAGCARLILPNTKSDDLLPFDQVAQGAFDEAGSQLYLRYRHCAGEMSRFAVRQNFRRRLLDHTDSTPLSFPDPHVEKLSGRHRSALISQSLCLAGVAMVLKKGLEATFAMMETRLARRLALHGLKFECMGKTIDYHGPRAPYLIRTENLFKHLDGHNKKLFAKVASQMYGDFFLDEIGFSAQEPSSSTLL